MDSFRCWNRGNCYTSYVFLSHYCKLVSPSLVILQLEIGKRAIPLWFKLFKYKQDGNRDFIYVEECLTFLHKVLKPYESSITILADRGFNIMIFIPVFLKTS